MKRNVLNITAIVMTMSTTLMGCTAIEKSNAMDTERVLSAAGFKMKFADTPDKLANLKTLTQRTVVPHQKDGEVYYAYADAEFCKCLYMGSQKAYQQYEKMTIEQNIAQMNENASMNWGMWGGGGWAGWY